MTPDQPAKTLAQVLEERATAVREILTGIWTVQMDPDNIRALQASFDAYNASKGLPPGPRIRM